MRNRSTGRAPARNIATMSDIAPRLTPYALVFEAPLFQEEHFPRIARDEDAFGVAQDAAQFIALDAGEALLQAVLPDEAVGPAAGPGRAPGGASAFVVDRYAALLFAAYRFWQGGREQYGFDEDTARMLLASQPTVSAWSLDEAPAVGYVQLPRHLVWAHADEDAPAEPVDGFFWVRTDGEAPGLAVVLVLGVRDDRPGFSVVDASDALPAEGHFANRPGRVGEPDFANFLPGGELQRLHGIRTGAEALRLASLCLWYITRHPEAVSGEGSERQVRRADG